MLNYILQIINTITESTLGKKLLIINATSSATTAAKSSLGFWYAGDVFNPSDIAYGIARNGIVENFETETVITILKTLAPNYTFLDIGANTGYYGILSAYMHPQSTTHSFEPIPAFADKIKESAALNQLKNIHIHNIAIGSQNEQKTIHIAGSGTTFLPNFTDIKKTDSQTLSVSVRTLDHMASSYNIPDFIKIDVEGFELEVLRGASLTIKNTPVFFIEIADTIRRKNSVYTHEPYAETIGLLQKAGYDGFVLDNKSYIPLTKKSAHVGIAMYLFLHRQKHQAIYNALNI